MRFNDVSDIGWAIIGALCLGGISLAFYEPVRCVYRSIRDRLRGEDEDTPRNYRRDISDV